MNDLKEETAAIMTYINEGVEVKELNDTMKVFVRAVRWRITQNDCQNRGYILENYPNFEA